MQKVIILGNYMRHFYYFDLYFLSVVYFGRFLPYTKQLLVLFHAHIGTEINTVKNIPSMHVIPTYFILNLNSFYLAFTVE